MSVEPRSSGPGRRSAAGRALSPTGLLAVLLPLLTVVLPLPPGRGAGFFGGVKPLVPPPITESPYDGVKVVGAVELFGTAL